MSTPRHHLLGPVACVALLAGAMGCTGDPAPPPTPSPTSTSTPLTAVDPDREALQGMLAELEETVTALRTELEAAAAGDEDALAAATELLVADVGAVTGDGNGGGARGDGGSDGGDDPDPTDADPDPTDDADATPPTVDLDGPPPILPGPVVSRAESIQYGDLLTRTLAAARGAGSQGEQAQRFLADPLAGDLGAWQRSPGDQLHAIASAGTAGDLETTQTAVLRLQGEAPRALAWVVHGLTVPADAPEAAERALAHLAIIDLALDQLA